MARWLLPILLTSGLVGVAAADVISMAEESCIDAERGAACEGEEGVGTCQPDRCCRLDYSQGTPPMEVCSDCLLCKPGSPSDGGPPGAEPAPDPNPEPEADADDSCDAGAGGRSAPIALALGLLVAFALRRSR